MEYAIVITDDQLVPTKIGQNRQHGWHNSGESKIIKLIPRMGVRIRNIHRRLAREYLPIKSQWPHTRLFLWGPRPWKEAAATRKASISFWPDAASQQASEPRPPHSAGFPEMWLWDLFLPQDDKICWIYQQTQNLVCICHIHDQYGGLIRSTGQTIPLVQSLLTSLWTNPRAWTAHLLVNLQEVRCCIITINGAWQNVGLVDKQPGVSFSTLR